MGATGTAHERVRLVYTANRDGRSEERELPLKLLVLGDHRGRAEAMPLESRIPLRVTEETFDQVLAGIAPSLELTVPDLLGDGGGGLRVRLGFTSLADFSPGSVARQVPELARMVDLRRALSAAKADDALDLGHLLGTAAVPRERWAIDQWVAELDGRLSRQLDAILHEPRFQALEAAWRGLRLLVRRADPGQDVHIDLLCVSREELAADFEDAPELVRSGLFKRVYTAEYGQFGGEPYAALVADFAFGPAPRDLALLQKIAAIAAMAHAPVLAAASPRFFAIDAFDRLPELADPAALTEGPDRAAWNAFRSSDDARCVGLVLPRLLLRAPYGADAAPTRDFAYEEEVRDRHASYLWGNPAYAFAARMAMSFASHRWYPDLVGGPDGGRAPGPVSLPYFSLGDGEPRIPTEALLSERCEAELGALGFIPLSARPGTGEAGFPSADSCQRGLSSGDGPGGAAMRLNHRLGSQLPYLLIVNRLAHYLKVLQRERIGGWADRGELERELNHWIGRYVIDMDDPEPRMRETHPLRAASVTVEEAPGDAGWYRVAVAVRPHRRHLGATFTLSLSGRLDRGR